MNTPRKVLGLVAATITCLISLTSIASAVVTFAPNPATGKYVSTSAGPSNQITVTVTFRVLGV